VWFVPPPAGVRTALLTSARTGPRGTLLTLSGVTDIDTARSLVGRELLVSSSSLPHGFFVSERVEESFDGFSVHDDAHGDLGTIVETIETGANDVWVLEGPLGEILIPVIDQVVLDVDVEQATIKVELLAGLLDEEE
jgi:16S rRNA processing protein RimM